MDDIGDTEPENGEKTEELTELTDGQLINKDQEIPNVKLEDNELPQNEDELKKTDSVQNVELNETDTNEENELNVTDAGQEDELNATDDGEEDELNATDAGQEDESNNIDANQEDELHKTDTDQENESNESDAGQEDELNKTDANQEGELNETDTGKEDELNKTDASQEDELHESDGSEVEDELIKTDRVEEDDEDVIMQSNIEGRAAGIGEVVASNILDDIYDQKELNISEYEGSQEDIVAERTTKVKFKVMKHAPGEEDHSVDAIPEYVVDSDSFYPEIRKHREPKLVAGECNRAYYEQEHERLLQVHESLTIKNDCINRVVADYFFKRRMEHVLKETEYPTTTLECYYKLLDVLDHLLGIRNERKVQSVQELKALQMDCHKRQEEYSLLFKQMQNREIIASRGVTYKSGNPISEKLVERLINRQKKQAMTLSQVRLIYIKVKNRVTFKQNRLLSLNDIGSDLHLMDYEQLKEDRQNLQDKFEDRQTEMTKCQIKYCSRMQHLAHIREKTALTSMDIEKLQFAVINSRDQYMQARQRLINFKKERDHYRINTVNMTNECGLLAMPHLIKDKNESHIALKDKHGELKYIKDQFKTKTIQVTMIRKNIEEHMMEKGRDPVFGTKKRVSIFKGRPSRTKIPS